MSRFLQIDPQEPEWRKQLVRELERALREQFPILFTDELTTILELRRERGLGRGVFVRDGVTVARGVLVGAYLGCVGSRYGPYSAEMLPVRMRGHPVWIPVIDGKELAMAGHIAHAALYNHTCSGATVKLVHFGSGRMRCALFYTSRKLRGGEQLVWNYGKNYAITAKESLEYAPWRIRPCRCGPGKRCTSGRWLLC